MSSHPIPGADTRGPLRPWPTCAAFLALLLASAPLRAQDLPYALEDPEKIKTAEVCGECHAAEYEVWKETTHATGFRTLHRTEQAEEIAGKLGFRLMKRDSPCIACHYTPTIEDGELRAASGVSCESCHGAGADWIDVHNDYGGQGVTHATETPEHRARRIEESRELGMRRPSDLYPVVKSCYGCHLVPDEELVNVGGHPLGSGNFEFVRWSQGEIRHNFLQSFLSGDGTKNAERPLERRRVMYVVGRAVALEAGLRGVARATGEGVYLKAMNRRVRIALSDVRAIAEEAGVEEMGAAVDLVRAVPVTLHQEDGLRRAADRIGELTRKFLAGADGTRLAGVDPLLQGGARVAEAAPPPSDGRPDVGPAADRRHPTLGPGACGGCHSHSSQNEWWFSDPHSKSAEAFFDQAEKNVEIARRYGVEPDDMVRGTAVCMTCHGTVVTGREQREVQDGVGCESCHGPAGDYVDRHQEGEKNLGAERPGYLAALKLGMVELRDLEVRAENCTSCHYVTNEKLLAAGHPSGEGFEFLAGMAKVRHWESPAPAGALQAAFGKVLEARGPIPRVEVVDLPPPSPPPSATRTVSDVTSPAEPAAKRPKVVGEVKTRLREGSPHGTLGPTTCVGCHRHQRQAQWWGNDAHNRSADPFFDDPDRREKIARLYGISSKDMTRGTQVCMDCHGTIVTGKEKRTVADGVGCESCHGAAADYLEPHQEGDKALGPARPGYVEALKLGMKELKKPGVSARTCAECHYVTDYRLLSAGHPSGADFDYLAGMTEVEKHSDFKSDPAALSAALRAELAKRGRAPAVEVASGREERGDPTRPPQTFSRRPYEGSSGNPAGDLAGDLGLPPFPEIDETTPLEEVLTTLKKRFELLYRKLEEKRRGGPP